MYAVFGIRNLLAAIVTMVILFTGIVMLIQMPGDAISIGLLAMKVGTYTVSGFLALGSIKPVFGFFWNVMNRILPSSFPNITGEWEGYLESNVTVQEILREAARSTDRQFDQFDPEQVEAIKLLKIPARITINANILKIDVTMVVTSRDKKSQSHSIAVKPLVSVNGEPHSLAYIFQSSRLNPEADDTSSHIGAAHLLLTRENDSLMLQGTYWTSRNWRRASNTAGALTFKRVKT
ncbi:hypothetical protein GV819_05440 [Pseudomonas sp. Fl5BN2]|uniref:hypothetical protein n=1 Tax=Pseudomonas sp. Fl5BN2 TaxID=2697652 RepID=UPI0013773C73|nr:hypothetical protein [Pseudomonas sp. Fl5BN2]NBF01730.1 hypothetical protein [Pseudomonas sp. Fl5BN2]